MPCAGDLARWRCVICGWDKPTSLAVTRWQVDLAYCFATLLSFSLESTFTHRLEWFIQSEERDWINHVCLCYTCVSSIQTNTIIPNCSFDLIFIVHTRNRIWVQICVFLLLVFCFVLFFVCVCFLFCFVFANLKSNLTHVLFFLSSVLRHTKVGVRWCARTVTLVLLVWSVYEAYYME